MFRLLSARIPWSPPTAGPLRVRWDQIVAHMRHLAATNTRGITIGSRCAVVSRSSDAHQPASLSDRETTGPAITDVGALLGNSPCCRAPLRTRSQAPDGPTI